MPKRYRAREVERVLVAMGWGFDHQRGSHAVYIREGHSHVTVPEHIGELAPGTLGSILRQMGVTRREFDRIAREVL